MSLLRGYRRVGHQFQVSPSLVGPAGVYRRNSSIKALHASFRDPASPFYLPPGTVGPEHEEDHSPEARAALSTSAPASSTTPISRPQLSADTVNNAAWETATNELMKLGYDPLSFWAQPIVWGDHDSFQHVNNVRYLRFFESGRIKWMQSLGHELGGASKAEDMIKGRGISLILKSVSLNYIRPVTYPDTLLIAHKPVPNPSLQGQTQKKPRTHFHMKAVAWSYEQGRIVTESDSVLVWYDYDRLAKCSPGEDMLKILDGRMKLCEGV